MAQKNQHSTPKAAMPRVWWVVLASIHSMTEQRIQTTHPNIRRFMDKSISSSQLDGMIKKGLLTKDRNTRVVYGLTNLAYEFLTEYSTCVTCEQDAEILGFYHQTLQINMMLREVAA